MGDPGRTSKPRRERPMESNPNPVQGVFPALCTGERLKQTSAGSIKPYREVFCPTGTQLRAQFQGDAWMHQSLT